jgi:hypothetical protein
MSRVSLRLRHLLIASLGACSVTAFAAAAAQDAAAPAPAPTPSHKHIGGVKYEDFAKSSAVSTAAPDGAVSSAAGDVQVIETQSISWGKVGDAGTVYSADPMEGGQVAAGRFAPGKPTYGNATFTGAPAAADTKPTVSEIPITKQTDVSSGKLSSGPAGSDEPGKLEYPNAQVAGGAEPVAKTTATFTTLAGKCVKGKHLDSVTITTRSRSYTLHDAVVTSVTPAGDGMETVSLTYASVGD